MANRRKVGKSIRADVVKLRTENQTPDQNDEKVKRCDPNSETVRKFLSFNQSKQGE